MLMGSIVYSCSWLCNLLVIITPQSVTSTPVDGQRSLSLFGAIRNILACVSQGTKARVSTVYILRAVIAALQSTHLVSFTKYCQIFLQSGIKTSFYKSM